jgi:hypothetical protein
VTGRKVLLTGEELGILQAAIVATCALATRPDAVGTTIRDDIPAMKNLYTKLGGDHRAMAEYIRRARAGELS